ncbi:MAG: phosphoribosylformylglycinamidine synthase subunit PurL [Chloroflexi bacterium]|nr:phosphoribosylformylglycinamidine synthase subunit PurL [Chloroflexota bacterium]
MTSAPSGEVCSPTSDLTDAEYQAIVERLGRQPNDVELGILAAMWSEHCGYKNSRALLGRLPTSGPRVVQGPGENAGAVDIGDGLLAVLKMESHNHPSAVEPFQGAATGVGGILRDIFTMGARPVALLDSLRFGPLDEGRNRYLFNGVIAGVGHYGNCIGVPTVGGEVYVDPSFSGNPLVNAMCVGIAEHERLTLARAGAPGDVVLIVGAPTGRDGIHGATFASAELGSDREERRPNVQVGNPFLEKLLLEACLSLLPTGLVRAMQDLGAAGLTSSSVEVAARGGRGIRLDVAKISRRERGMTAYEMMLSESQERMLLVVAPESVPAVQAHFDRWELHSDLAGEITDDGEIAVLDDGREVGRLPIPLLTDEVPRYVREGQPRPVPGMPDLPPEPPDLGDALLGLLASPNVCSRRPVFQTYDHTVQANTMVEPSLGAGVVRVRGTSKALAFSTDCNPRYCYADPRRGAAIAVAEAARNVTCRGAEPVAATDCLNFGSPERPEVYWELSDAIDGLADACRALDVPIVSGNVSLYNESDGVAIKPSPIIGMVGLIADRSQVVGSGFQVEGDAVLLAGPAGADLGCSEYLAQVLGRAHDLGPAPSLDLAVERSVQRFVREAARRGLLRSAHDCSEGGLAVTVAESCLAGGLGFQGAPHVLDALRHEAAHAGQPARTDAILFGEGQSRIVVSCAPDAVPALFALAREIDGVCPLRPLGTVGGGRLDWLPALSLPLTEVSRAWNTPL